MWDRFGGENVLFLSASYKGELIAGVIIIIDRVCAYYLNGASKHDFRSLAPNNLLLWEACRIAKEREVKYFDFVGSDIQRLTEFKKSIGGKLITHSLVEKAGSQWVRFLRNKYPVYRKTIGNIREKLNF
jgi:lipid II:glycine glycyltransferase (peptidoglycan interpeptide bridge formation enzyme)